MSSRKWDDWVGALGVVEYRRADERKVVLARVVADDDGLVKMETPRHCCHEVDEVVRSRGAIRESRAGEL